MGNLKNALAVNLPV